MERSELYYEEPFYRPPSEGKKSLLLTATVGCSFNCTFCIPYRHKKFRIRPIQEIKADIRKARRIYGDHVERIFLLDGNAFVIKPATLIEITKTCYENHPRLQRISAYAHAKDILRKSDSELKKIREAGLNLVYMGIETGDDELLEKINKHTTAAELTKAAQKLHKAGITLSGTIILGLAGADPELSHRHAVKTANLINAMNPPSNQDWYISALTLMIPKGTPIAVMYDREEFIPLSQKGILNELRTIIAHTSNDLQDCIFRSNHASNYLVLKGVLSQDKGNFLQKIEIALRDPSILRPDFFRGL
ncbi:MAG: B12-binding domain-containing radical SAM protein [Promethearchaeota archaeon]